MVRYLNTSTVAILAVLVLAGLGVAYLFGGIGAGNLVFLGILTVALGVIAAIFLTRMTHPDVSIEQMLYKTDHRMRP